MSDSINRLCRQSDKLLVAGLPDALRSAVLILLRKGAPDAAILARCRSHGAAELTMLGVEAFIADWRADPY